MTRRGTQAAWAVTALAGLVLAGCASGAASMPGRRDDLVKRGYYLVRIMDCGGCHTPGSLAGNPDHARALAGSDIGMAFPGGIVYPPNLTPHPDAGLGRWTDEQIVRAIRQGARPDGRALVPIMPWPSYAALTDDDARALVSYLRTIPPVAQRAPANVKPGEKPTAPYVTIMTP